MQKILVVLTNASKIESVGKPTGWFLPELSHPYDVLASSFEIIFCSPLGGLAPVDPMSIEMFKGDPSCVNFLKYMSNAWHNTTPLHQFLGHANEFAAIFFPGGHGPVFDLRVDPDVIAIIEQFYKAGKIIASVCHGPMAMSEVVIDGVHLLKGKTVTGLSNEEEEASGMTHAMPKLLESDFIEKGANFVKADGMFQPKVVQDGLILTGQNPASAKPMAEMLREISLKK